MVVASSFRVRGAQWRRAPLIAWLATGALLLGGCGGGAPRTGETPSDGASVTESASSTQTPSRGPTDWPKPERPAAMDRDDVVGAKAAAQYFIEFYPYVYGTGDLEDWRAMSDPECIFCQSVIDNVEELHEDGGYGVGAEITVEEVAGAEPVEGNPYYSVDLRVQQAPAAEYSATGAQTDADSGGETLLLFAMEWTGDGWSVREVQVEDPDELA